MKRLAPGVYDAGDGSLHLSIPELLADSNVADTPENREALTRAAERMFADLGLPIEVEP